MLWLAAVNLLVTLEQLWTQGKYGATESRLPFFSSFLLDRGRKDTILRYENFLYALHHVTMKL